MKPIRIGIIGFGIMGSNHLKHLKTQSETYEVTALCDTNPERFNCEDAKGIAQFTDYRQLLSSGLCDMVAVATPHPCHGEISMAAFRQGLHVMCEKPLTETVAKTDALLAAAQEAGTVFSTNFSMRTNPVNKVIREMLDREEIGKILRVDFVCTEWIRSQAYYDMQSWRGRWLGEGGGVLMNQAPHNLDLLHWWFGEMESVRGVISTRLHDIETEDEVEATFISKKGFPIRFYANTGEVPGIDRIEIVGDKGTLIREGGKLTFRKLELPVSAHLAGSQPFPLAKSELVEVPVPEAPRGAPVIWANIAEAVNTGAPLIAPGADAWAAVEFANAITLSHFTQAPVKFPVDRQAYDTLLNDLINQNKGLK